MLYKLISLPLLPVFLYQGKKVKKNMPRLLEAEGKREGTSTTLSNLSLLILGDSAAAGVGADVQKNALSGQIIENLKGFDAVSWELIAKSGKTTKDTIEYLEKIENKKYDIIVLSTGVNDVLSPVDAKKWIKNVEYLINILRKKFESKLILFTNLPPMSSFTALPQPLRWYLGSRAKEFNLLLDQIFKNTDDVHNFNINFGKDQSFLAKDGFHPSEKGYKLWGKIVADLINESGLMR